MNLWFSLSGKFCSVLWDKTLICLQFFCISKEKKTPYRDENLMRTTQVIQKNDVISPKKSTSVLQERQSRSQASDEPCAGLPQPKRTSPWATSSTSANASVPCQLPTRPVQRVFIYCGEQNLNFKPQISKAYQAPLQARTPFVIVQHSWFLKGPCNHPSTHPSIIFHLSRIRLQWHLFPHHFPMGSHSCLFPG